MTETAQAISLEYRVNKSFRYYRGKLRKEHHAVYDRLVTALCRHESTFDPGMPVTNKEMHRIYDAVDMDTPELLHIPRYAHYFESSAGKITSVGFSYAVSLEEHSNMLSQVEIAAKPILAECRGMTPLEATKHCHDWFCVNARYETGPYKRHSAYGALIDRVCCCEGFATAMKYLLTRAGVKCLVAVGNGSAKTASQHKKTLLVGNHAWNIVSMGRDASGNEAWVHVDTSNDVCITGRLGKTQDHAVVRYDDFGLSDNECAASHSFNVGLPRCLRSLGIYQHMGLWANTKADIARILQTAWTPGHQITLQLGDESLEDAASSLSGDEVRRRCGSDKRIQYVFNAESHVFVAETI